VSKVVGVGFFAPRLLSFVASLATMGVLGIAVRKETGRFSAGLVAAGLYALAFRATGDWYDLARVDSLFVLLSLCTLLAGRTATTWRSGAWVGVLGFLAFFTKQSAAFAIGFAMLYLLARRPRAGASAIAVAVALTGISTVVLDALTGGWYRYYVFDELPSQGISMKGLLAFWRGLWHVAYPEATVGMIGLLVVLVGWRGAAARFGAGYWLAAAAGLLGASWVSKQHVGGYLDVLMPAYVALALGGGLAWGWALGPALSPGPATAVPRWRSTSRMAVAIVLPVGIIAALALQFNDAWYPIERQIPTVADAQAGQALLALLKRIPGNVIVLNHPWYATEVGKGAAGQGEAIRDIIRGGPSTARTTLEKNLAAELPHESAVILDDPGDSIGIAPVLAKDFTRVPLPWNPGTAFKEVTDLRLRPSELYLRNGTTLLPVSKTVPLVSTTAPLVSTTAPLVSTTAPLVSTTALRLPARGSAHGSSAAGSSAST
jgi:hypothetical protein